MCLCTCLQHYVLSAVWASSALVHTSEVDRGRASANPLAAPLLHAVLLRGGRQPLPQCAIPHYHTFLDFPLASNDILGGVSRTNASLPLSSRWTLSMRLYIHTICQYVCMSECSFLINCALYSPTQALVRHSANRAARSVLHAHGAATQGLQNSDPGIKTNA